MDLSNTRFLVVDDMALMRKIVSQELRRLGAKNIEVAQDGREAVEILKQTAMNNKPIEFVVSDWNMPQMTGLELLKVVRKVSVYRNLPFLMVTAEGQSWQVKEAVSSGVDGYVLKPFTPKQFEDKLLEVFQKRLKAAA